MVQFQIFLNVVIPASSVNGIAVAWYPILSPKPKRWLDTFRLRSIKKFYRKSLNFENEKILQ